MRGVADVRVDTQRQRVRAGGGATWRDVDPACQLHGLALPGGTFDATGIGGLTLGGLGYLLGTLGLTLDNLVAAEVVTPNGEVVEASDEDHGLRRRAALCARRRCPADPAFSATSWPLRPTS